MTEPAVCWRTVKAAEDLREFQFSPIREKAVHYLEEYHKIRELGAEETKEDFRRNGADYYAILEEYGGSVLEKPLIYSSIPAQLASAVDETEIDLSSFKGHLRSYQLFGAKYILFERRVLLGDEMGLGKTVQAVAAMCDIYAGDPKSLFLVVCPASVLVNWCREIKKFSAIETYLLHGSFLEEEFDRWKEHGGAAVTNFETMGKIVDDIDKRLKIVIYSFFRETVEKVRGLLGGKCIGVITGSTEISERQGMIDQLEDAKDGSVLLCQIQAGGTGLNIQAASVAIFCEPQIKPSLTNQAIARVYRMGQVRNVLVYHLLCENTVDEAVVQILERKQQEFDTFADESSIGEAMDNLVDKEWIRELIEKENENIIIKH